MANQIIIDIGAVANDGTGDPLRTAFGYVNNNFSNIWATGVANSNVAFDGNKLITVNTNGNLILAPNGTGKVQANVDIVPNMANSRNLGALNNRWSTVYTQYLNVSSNVDFTGDVTVDGNLTVNGTTTTINTANVDIEDKVITIAYGSPNAAIANGSGITVAGANANIIWSNTAGWTLNDAVVATGNITAPYFLGNASQMTGLPEADPAGSNTQIQFNDGGAFGADADFYFDKTTNTLVVNGNLGEHSAELGATGFTELNANVILQVTANANSYTQINFQNIDNGSSATTDYIATAAFGTDSTFFIDMGYAGGGYDQNNPNNSLGNALFPQDGYVYTQGLNGTYGNLVLGSNEANGVVRIIADGSFISNIVATFSKDGIVTKGDIVPVASNTYSLGNATNQWSDLWVSNATIFMNSVPISLTAGNVLTVDGEAVLTNDSNTTITTTGNITGGNINTTGQVVAAGNITGGNLISTNGLYANVDLIVGDRANASASKGRFVSNSGFMYLQVGNGTPDSTGNIVFSPYQSSTARVTVDTASGNITAVGNITGGNILGNGASMTGVVTKTTGTWTVTSGTNTYSFTVPPSGVYQLWIEGNIANGIIAYNATVSVTNTNVPVIGQQFAWNYEGAGNPIAFTSIPAQIIGTAGAISNASPVVGTTTNTFDFGINNSSGNTVTVNYGYTKIS